MSVSNHTTGGARGSSHFKLIFAQPTIKPRSNGSLDRENRCVQTSFPPRSARLWGLWRLSG